MRDIENNASREEIIKAINNLVMAYNAIIKTVSNISASAKFAQIVQEIDKLEKKLISQDDLIVSLIAELRNPK